MMDNANQQVPSQPANSNQWLKTLGIGFGIVSFGIAIGVIGYMMGTKSNQTVVENQQSAVVPTAIPTPTPIPDETANWKTYTNIKYEYSLRYPSSYTPYGFDNNRNPLSLNSESAYYIMFRDKPIPKEYNDTLPNALWIAVMDRKEFEDLKTKLEKSVKKAPCGGCPTKSTSLINGIVADVYDGYGGYTLDKIFLIEYKQRFYMLSYDRATDPKYATYPYDISEAMIYSFKLPEEGTNGSRVCPDNWVEFLSPIPAIDNPYYGQKGQFITINDSIDLIPAEKFDLAWIKQNCKVKEPEPVG